MADIESYADLRPEERPHPYRSECQAICCADVRARQREEQGWMRYVPAAYHPGIRGKLGHRVRERAG